MDIPLYTLKWAPLAEPYFAISHGHDIKFFQYIYGEKREEERCQFASFVSLNQYIRCFEWSKCQDRPYLMVCGLNNGKVILIDAKKSIDNEGYSTGLFDREFCSQVMKIRKCNVISWNKMLPSQVACAYEPLKDEESLYIWDLAKASAAPTETDVLSKENYYGPRLFWTHKLKTKKERIDDISWVPDSSTQILAMTEKMIRLYDVRMEEDSAGFNRSGNIYKEKSYIGGISFNPFNSKMFAAFYGNEVSLWDLRALKEPVATFKHPCGGEKCQLQVEWFGNQPGILMTGCKGKESHFLFNFWHLQDQMNDKQKLKINPIKSRELASCEEIKKFREQSESPPGLLGVKPSASAISSFSVVPNTSDIMYVSYSGKIKQFQYQFIDHTVFDFSPWNEIFFTMKNKMFTAHFADNLQIIQQYNIYPL